MENRTYFEKQIKELSPNDTNVSLSGVIVSKNSDSFVLDDGSDQIVIFKETELPINTFVRVFGRVIPNENIQIQGHLIQDISKIDKLLYKKTQNLLK